MAVDCPDMQDHNLVSGNMASIARTVRTAVFSHGEDQSRALLVSKMGAARTDARKAYVPY
jgi:hypothetical protein